MLGVELSPDNKMILSKSVWLIFILGSADRECENGYIAMYSMLLEIGCWMSSTEMSLSVATCTPPLGLLAIVGGPSVLHTL